MRWKEYQRMTLAQMKQRKWRTTQPLSNGNMEVPAGTVVEITQKYKGLSLTSAPCSCCGVRVRISRVPADCVEEIE